MRSSTRRKMLALVFSLCLAATLVFVSVLLVKPADAQTYMVWWDRDYVEVLESDREVVLTLKKSGPGSVHYQTEDGKCTGDRRLAATNPCMPSARAPDDYEAGSGDEVYTGADSRTIRIPIVDDNLDEGSEVFSVFAYDGDRNDLAAVRILDDPKPSSGSSASPDGSGQQTAGSQAGSPARALSPPLSAPVSSGSTGTGNQSVSMNPDDTLGGPDGSNSGKEVRPYVGKTGSKDKPSSSVPQAGVRAMLLVTIVAAGYGLKKRLVRSG